MDGRVRGGELRGEQQRPDAQEAKEVGKVQHAIRALPGFRCDKAARMVSSGPLQSALRGGLEVPVFPVAGLTALMGDGADLHQITAQSVDQSHSVLLDVVSLDWLFRVPDVCVFTQFSDRLVQGLRKFLCGHGTVLVDPHVHPPCVCFCFFEQFDSVARHGLGLGENALTSFCPWH